MKKIPLLFLVLLLTAMMCLHVACKKANNPIYYETVGVGYVYDATNNRPLPGIIIAISYYSSSSAWFPISNKTDFAVTDATGCYQVHFIEKMWSKNEGEYYKIRDCIISVENAEKYASYEINYPYIFDSADGHTSGTGFHVYSRDYLNEIDILVLDTIKFYKINN